MSSLLHDSSTGFAVDIHRGAVRLLFSPEKDGAYRFEDHHTARDYLQAAVLGTCHRCKAVRLEFPEGLILCFETEREARRYLKTVISIVDTHHQWLNATVH